MLSLNLQKEIAFAKDEAKTEAEFALIEAWENMWPIKQKSAVEYGVKHDG